MRWMRFCSKPGRKNSRGQSIETNGFAPAFLVIGGSIFIDEDRFFEIVDEQNRESAA